jgi:phosphoglycerol transferase MdoB-like AlkP superfamily enzyme
LIKNLKIPRTVPITIQWVVKLWTIYFILFTLFRIATVFLFKPPDMSVASLGPSFLLGFKFDMRWIAMILLPITLLSVFRRLSPFYSERNKRYWSVYLAVATLIVLFFYGADFGNFSYNHTRINASALNFAEDPVISFRMLWQSYPMIWILLGLVFSVFMLVRLFKKTHVQVFLRNNLQDIKYKRRWHLLAVLFLGWCIFGVFSFRPLKWSDAFVLNDNFRSYLALNPFQNFFTTLKFRTPSVDEVKAKQHYPLVAKFLQLNSLTTAEGTYSRTVIPGSHSLESNPNVVLVIAESFSMYKSSLSGNPLNTTPYFHQMAQEGIFFNRCFTPTFGTARGVFAILTGTPDVQLSKFSTRNPEAINQRTIINDFVDHEKFYFIGGSSDFNNFRGLVQNIKGVTIREEGHYESPELNVWGISDKNLFLEANKTLAAREKPFFAIIQTADNHRPFTIPEEDVDFVKRNVPQDSLLKYGFGSLEEFHAFAYSDYCIKKFMEAAKKEKYFENTIFVFIGDHGVEGNASEMYPRTWTSHRLSDEHVPLLYYAPKLLTPQWRNEVVSQVDVLPTLAGMIHQPYTNTTLGRDLLAPGKLNNVAFIIHHDEGNIGVVTDDFYYIKNLRITREELVSVKSNQLNISNTRKDSVMSQLSELTSAIYETAKWMLVNNKQ